MSEWQDISSAPKDGTRILRAGYWNDLAMPQSQGKPYVGVASWSTFMSNGTGYQWIDESGLGGGPFDAVTFTHWMPLPDPPKDTQ